MGGMPGMPPPMGGAPPMGSMPPALPGPPGAPGAPAMNGAAPPNPAGPGMMPMGGMNPAMGGMNPMMPMGGMNPVMGGMNPMMVMMGNPMMAMMMAAMSSGAAGASSKEEGTVPEEKDEEQAASSRKGKGKGKRAPNAEHCLPPIDPQIEHFCNSFGITENKIQRRLHDAMANREDTFDADMKQLWKVCEGSDKPVGSLIVKIQELEQGRFTGTEKLDQAMLNFRARYKLGDKALSRFVEIIHPLAHEDKKNLIRTLEKHIKDASNPSQAILPLLTKIQKEGRLSSPGRKRERSRERRRYESQSKSRSRSRRRR
eukprot:TRINITY_DN109852_c0_g1_i1.p1 TRINITY_DN109852_c0_g1~~TRINITY_DN109852_c0_g1_i1.p1  ORF type:complete len:314 (+),score=71.35 TRINITY_DN109852_c0_g1_i1:1-942(+)